MVTIQEYIAKDGRNHYREWFSRLAAPAAAKAAVAVARIAAGNTSNFKGIGHALAEWKIDWGPGLRLYVHQDGDRLVVMLGGSNKSDQSSEINAAAVLAAEYRARKKVDSKSAKAIEKITSKDAKIKSGKATRRK